MSNKQGTIARQAYQSIWGNCVGLTKDSLERRKMLLLNHIKDFSKYNWQMSLAKEFEARAIQDYIDKTFGDKTFNLDAFRRSVQTELSKNLGLREGQIAYNKLQNINGNLTKEIRGTDLDPFYGDKKLPAFYNWLVTK